MIIKRIKLENIRSYESLELEFPLGSVLLSGDIGSGKTTILLAIEFALFGLQPGQKGSSLLRSGKDYGRVVLDLVVSGDDVKIERSLVKKGKSISQEETSITINGSREDISVSELKNRVLTLLNYPMEFAKKTNLLYKFTVYTPQEEMKQIILEDTQTRLNAIRHVFGVNKYKTIRENIGIINSFLREDIRNKEGIIRDLDKKKQTLDERSQILDVLEKNLQSAENEYSVLVAGRKNVEVKLDGIKDKISEKNKLEQEIEKTKVAISGKRELIIRIDSELKKLRDDVDSIKELSFSEMDIKSVEDERKKLVASEELEKKNHFEILTKIKSLQTKNLDFNSLKQRIQQLQLCPTCLQNVDNDYKQNILKRIDDDIIKNHEELKKLQESDRKFNSFIESISDKKRVLDDKFSKLQVIKIKVDSLNEKKIKIDDDEKRKQEINKDVDMLSKHVDLLKGSIVELSKYDNLFRATESEFKEALRLEREADISKERIRKEIEMTKKLIEEMKEEIKKKEDVKEKLVEIVDIHEWLSKQFLDLVAFTERNVLLKLREEFSKIFNEWFNILVPDVFSVSLDEDFTPLVYQRDFELDYSFLSGGERTAIALAYRLALNKTINSVFSGIKTRNLVILDEPTDGFSEQQLDKMRDVLQELDVEQLIIVSHEQKIEGFVEGVVRLKKEAGVSGVEK